MNHIAVIGTGYVGLVSGACFAHVGYHIVCLDIDENKINSLQQGIIPIYEPQLPEIVHACINNGRLSFTTDYIAAIAQARVVLLSVDTPTGADGKCDVSRIERAAMRVADVMQNDITVVIKSTVPVGTARRILHLMQERLHQRKALLSINIVSNPEFLREGNAVHDFLYPERIILGVASEASEEIMRDLYRPFQHSNEKFIIMDTSSSELTKYAANSMLACRISFMNWLSQLCDKTGADIECIRTGISSDPRIGRFFLHAGMGYGGSCFPKDVAALCGMAKEHELDAPLIEAIEQTNRTQKRLLGTKILSYFEQRGGIANKTIAILGLAFKPNTDDMREAPSLILIEQLLSSGANLHLFDPVAIENAKKIVCPSKAITWHTDPYAAMERTDAVAIVTEWDCCKELDLVRTRKLLNGNAIFDGRNIFDPEEMSRFGFDYFSQGRPHYNPENLSNKACESLCPSREAEGNRTL